MITPITEAPENLFHEVTTIFPAMREEEYAQLAADIQKQGLLEPLWTYQGKIIDGRHRYRVCQQFGIEPLFQEWDGCGSLVAFVVNRNVQRRHLTRNQKAIVALEIEEHLDKEAERRRKANVQRRKQLPDGRLLPHRQYSRSLARAASMVGSHVQVVVAAKR